MTGRVGPGETGRGVEKEGKGLGLARRRFCCIRPIVARSIPIQRTKHSSPNPANQSLKLPFSIANEYSEI